MLKVSNDGGNPQVVALATWPFGQLQETPSHVCPASGQTHWTPSQIRPPVQDVDCAVSGIEAEVDVPHGLVAVAVQTVLPGFWEGTEPLPVSGAKLTESGLAPVQLIDAETVPDPEMLQLAAWPVGPALTIGGVMVKTSKDGGNPQLVALGT